MADPVSGAVSSISVQQLSPPVEQSTMQSGIIEKLEGVRQGSLENHDLMHRGPVAAPNEIKVGPAEMAQDMKMNDGSQGEIKADIFSPHLETLRTMSDATWNMVSFEMSNAALQKTDKSIKMFVQGN